MALKSVATTVSEAIDYRDLYGKLSATVSDLSLDLLKIKAIAQLVVEDSDFNRAEFPEEICGGVLAILDIASRGYDKAGAAD